MQFQSTHPVWDATRQQSTRLYTRPISIHASRMGCDGTVVRWRNARRYFNPRIPYGMRLEVIQIWGWTPVFQSTHPVWDATSGHGTTDHRQGISIHASRMGCDMTDRCIVTRPGISIHASRMGCDQPVRRYWKAWLNFNPRIPYGMRHLRSERSQTVFYFNPRIPYGMRLCVLPRFPL